MFSDGQRGQSAGANDARSALYMLWGVSTLVLLIACLNVSNLLLARGAERMAELALRASLGATRWRLMRQLLSEALVIGLLGALLGLPFAALVISTLGERLSTIALGGIAAELNIMMSLFALGVGLASVLIVGLFPGISLARAALMTSLRAGNRHSGSALALKFRHSLAIAQIALSTAALVIAGLFAQSLYNIHHADAGIAIESLSTFSVSPERIGFDQTRSRALFEEVQEKLAALPGVTSVSSSMVLLLTGDRWGWGIEIAGRTQEPGQDHTAFYSRVGEDFFATLQTPMLLGREFGPEDHDGSEAVAVVNRAFVDKFSLGDNPIGQRFRLGGSGGGDIRIVGMVGDLAYDDVRNTSRPVFFTPWRQSEWLPMLNFYVRSSLPAEQTHSAIRGLMQEISPGLPVDDLRAVRESVALNVAIERLIGLLTTGFAVLATLLAAVGLYGVVNYALTQRTREFGLRLALGAQPTRLKHMLFMQVSRMLLIGCGLGVLVALISGGAAEAMLFGLSGHDPKVTLLAVLIIVAVGLAATALPARRLGHIEPLQALR